ncbi:MAG: peptidase M3, partial [Spirochaetaceae bacterium]|nr:peptidase M3 [Spirochaetaceae bacterium]
MNRWDLSKIYSGFDKDDYKQAVKNYIEGMDNLDKLLADKNSQEKDFSQWLAEYIELSNKVGALEESLNAYAYSSYSTDTTSSVYLNNLSYLEELSLRTSAQALSFQQ